MRHWQCLFRCLAPNKSWPLLFLRSLLFWGGSPGDSAVKNPPANAGDAGGVGSIPGLERSNQAGMATHSSFLAGRVTQTEEPGGLRFMGSQRIRQAWDGAQHRVLLFSETHTLGTQDYSPFLPLTRWKADAEKFTFLPGSPFFHINIRKCRELYSL